MRFRSRVSFGVGGFGGLSACGYGADEQGVAGVQVRIVPFESTQAPAWTLRFEAVGDIAVAKVRVAELARFSARVGTNPAE